MPIKQTYEGLQGKIEVLEKENNQLRQGIEDRQLIENLNTVLYVLDQNALVPFISTNVERIGGYFPEKIIGCPFTDFVHPDDLAHRIGNFQKILSGEDMATEYRFLSRSGSPIWVRTHGNPVIRNGEAVSVQGILVDITNIKRAEEETRHSKKKFRQLFDNSVDAIFIHAPDGRILEVNEVACTQTGYTRQELLNMTPMDIVSRGETSKILNKIQTSNQKDRYIFETIHKKKDGIEYPVEVKTRKIDFNGIPAILGVARNITERKIRENLLSESERQKELILNSSAEKIIYYDKNYRIIWANRAAARVAGKPEDEIVNQYCYEIFQKCNTPCPNCIIQKAKNTQKSQEVEEKSQDGRYWHKRAYPSLDDSGNVDSIIVFSQDITEKKRAEEEKIKLQEQFQQTQKLESIGCLAGGVAHDLNNLLSPILGYGEMLLESAEKEGNGGRKEQIEHIMEAGTRARGLVRQLLAFSRRQVLEFKNINLNELLRNFEKLLSSTLNKDIAMKTELTDKSLIIKGDTGQIEQVILNLAINAQDAMPHGGALNIETAVVELDEHYAKQHNGVHPGTYAMLEVTDNGVGMNSETKDKIFEPFFSTKGKDRGTGLGLSTAYGIVKQHGGNIWTYSEPTLGTTFKVYLPISEEQEIIIEDLTPKTESDSKTKDNATIMVAEDDEAIRELVISLLEQQGYKVLAGKNGNEVFSIINHHDGTIDLLLTDIIMSDINGKELYGQLSRISPDLKAIFMSGYTENLIAQHGYLESACEFIQKPFSLKELVVKVQKVLGPQK